MILSESLWRSRFNADPSLVGKTILIDGQKSPGCRHCSCLVPASSYGAEQRGSRSFVLSCSARRRSARLTGNYNYAAVVRVRPGATAEQALAEINVVQARFQRPASKRS